MSTQSQRAPSRAPGKAAAKLKAEALVLFARHGIDSVSVRDIAQAAGQRNHASVTYYYGSKDDLVDEILLDGAVLIDQRRNEMLDALEARDTPLTLADAVAALVLPAVDFAPKGDMQGYHRFFLVMEMTYRDRFLALLEGVSNHGYLRCIDHFRRLMPGVSAELQTQRFVFIGRYLPAVLAARESRLEDTSREHPFWEDTETIAQFQKTIVSILKTE